MNCTPSPPTPPRIYRVMRAAEFWRLHCAPDDNVRCNRSVFVPGVARMPNGTPAVFYAWTFHAAFQPCPDGAVIRHD